MTFDLFMHQFQNANGTKKRILRTQGRVSSTLFHFQFLVHLHHNLMKMNSSAGFQNVDSTRAVILV